MPLDPEYAKKIGVKIDQLLISQPDTGEQALEIVESLVRSGKIDVIVIDSVAALTPKDEIEGDMGAYMSANRRDSCRQALRKFTAIVSKIKDRRHLHQPDPHADWRHVRQSGDDAGRQSAEILHISAHRHPPHRADQEGRRDDGRPHRVKIVKNKVAAPFRQTEFDLMYNEGISKEGETLALGEKMDLLKNPALHTNITEKKSAGVMTALAHI